MKVAQYKRIYNALNAQIAKKEFLEGDLLPSENVLTTQFGVARSVVRQALLELEKEGKIVKQQGKGSIVAPERKSLALLSVKGFSQVVGTERKINTIMLQNPIKRKWDSVFFFPLSEKELAADCFYLKRLRLVDNEPVMLENTYLPDLYIEDFLRQKFVDGSLFQLLKSQYNIEIKGVEQELRAINAEADLATNLAIEPNQAVLHVQRKYITNKKDFFIYSSLFCNTHNYSFSNIIIT